MGPDDRLSYRCDYANDTDAPIEDGESAATNEMCMAIGYYLPSQGKNTWCFGSSSLTF